MSPDRFAEVFGGAFVIRRVERGKHGERAFGWAATFSSAYFTSDTDRLVGRDHGHDEDYPLGWGASIEEALDALANHMLDLAGNTAKSAAESQRKAEAELAELREKLAK